MPSLRGDNLRRLTFALDELGAERADGQTLTIDEATIKDEPLLQLDTPSGRAEDRPRAGRHARGLRRPPTRGDERTDRQGLRPQVASIRDLARMVAALGRERDQPILYQLRYLAELERGLSRGIER